MDEPLPSPPVRPGAGYFLCRFAGAFLDLFICAFLFYFIGMLVAGKFDQTLDGWSFNLQGIPALWTIGLWLLACFFYFWILEAFFGRTFGKMIMNLKVRRVGDRPCGFAASAIRNLLRIVDYFFFYLVGIILILVTPKQQRLGDMAAKTVVIRKKSAGLQMTGVGLFFITGSCAVLGGYWIQSKMAPVRAPLAVSLPKTTISLPPLESNAPSLPKAADGEIFIQQLRFTEGEGGPPVQKSYEPGGEIFLSFEVVGLAVDAPGKNNASIKFDALDPQEKLMLEPTIVEARGPPPGGSGSPVPVNYHLTLPAYAMGGKYPLKVSIDDRLSGKNLVQTIPYTVVGPTVPSAATLSPVDYTFLSENGSSVADASYPPGTEIKSKFKVLGFKVNPQNDIKVRLDMFVESSSGEKLLEQPGLIEVNQNFFYPPSYLPVTTSVDTPAGIAPGRYTIHYILHDDVAGTQVNFNQSFMIK